MTILFGIWGILKSRLFSPRPQTMLQLKLRLDQEVARLAADQPLLRWTKFQINEWIFIWIEQEVCVHSLLGRAHSVIQANGGYLENWILSPFVENCPTDDLLLKIVLQMKYSS